MTNETKTEHTPTPWKVIHGKFIIVSCNEEELGYYSIAEIADVVPKCPTLANAEFIVKACNSHEKLVEALKLAQWHLEQRHACHPDLSPMREIKQALSEAEGS